MTETTAPPVDLTRNDWYEDVEGKIRTWLQAVEGHPDSPWDTVGEDLSYYGSDFENAVEDLIAGATGSTGLSPLFHLPGCHVYIDQIADGERIIQGFRYILTPTADPTHPMGAVSLASGPVDTKNATDDRDAVGVEQAVAILTAAGREYHRLFVAFRALARALTSGLHQH